MTTLSATIYHRARLVLWEKLSIPRCGLTLFLLDDVCWFEYTHRLLILGWPLSLMLEACHLSDNLLLFGHAKDHVTRLNCDRGLSLMRL